MSPVKLVVVWALYFVATTCAVNVETVADGFVWAENLVCDAKRNVFYVSDCSIGTLSKISYRAGKYVTVPHIREGLDSILGLAMNEEYDTLYAAATLKNETGEKDYVVIAVDITQENSFTIVAHIPESGNGVALDWTSNLLYVTTEGNFKPKAGRVFEINPKTGDVRDFVSDLYAADGAYIDQKQRLLYVSQVVGSKVMVYDLTWTAAAVPLRTFNPVGVKMLDDFTLSEDAQSIIGADFREGTVVKFSLKEGTEPFAEVLADGLVSTTSARLGCGTEAHSGFPPSSLFVTEGGGLTRRADDRRVLKIDL